MSTPVTVAAPVRFPEGPVWCPDAGPGSVVFTSVPDGALYRVDLASGAVTTVGVAGGGANAAAPTADGGFVVTQNGGIDFSGLAGLPGIDVSGMPPYAPVTPGLQVVGPDGSVGYLLDSGFLAPNDMTATADGVLYFTDPPHHPPPPEPVGRVHAVDPDGTVRLVADGFVYCNGIALEPGGTLAVIEARGVLRLDPTSGAREWIIETLGEASGDGMAVDADGRLYVCCTSEHAVRVLEPDGTEVDRLQVPGPGLLTNCCFGGPDLRTLFVAEGVPGAILAFEGLPTPGLAVNPWPVPTVG
ncbi:MAG: SMP-30/gluconolactonase/LRE family protein [Actinobacteria bacterium]|nr:SMP-30/gluconolactonase/LRE family protein [Actinomycetota bacterium]